jgi:NADH-quinone oxidoreductase subunit C
MDLTAVDWLNQGMPERFCVVYNLYSFKENTRTRVKAFVPEGDPVIDSVSSLWRAAPWAEREVWDFFGIKFKGHPGLKRIQLPENYEGHPLRKDYPLTGRGERMNFPRYVP